ncbi:NUDIX hydrolase [Actinomycetospora lemnae]|uniref:NUDIX domain-containing protein n=1 Tax=Actinomycetospora lemnae TaxID=3019891 RepID=A0ABT5SQJ9_9PSEU|nr:NUDIX domain-containing protein [Actinomycetospora sp. DW7H6]MDD7965059.1 NUDIX domain-containing protein [Actinomycetospora sp. DW7H6]
MTLLGPTGVLVVIVVTAVLLLVIVTAAVLIGRARRLDRLHVRTDAAAAGLAAVLDRRAAIVRAIAATAGPVALADADRRALRSAARAATATRAAGEGVLDAEREETENDLTRALAPLDTAALPADLAAELADVHARISVARRIYNDAVRDTRALRGRRMVRWLRLAGTAPMPPYFEIAEPGPDGVVLEPAAVRVAQDAVRAVVVDDDGRVLLFEGVDPARPAEAFWFAPGGGVATGEDPAAAVARTVGEETGLAVDTEQVRGPLWVREVVFEADGTTYAGRELFHAVHVPSGDIDATAFTEHEARTVRGHRWWTPAELAVTLDVVHPHQLPDLLADPRALEPGPVPLAIH